MILYPRRALDPRRDVHRVRASPPDGLSDVVRGESARDEQRDRPAAAFEEGPVERHPGPSGHARDGRVEENAGASVENRVRRNLRLPPGVGDREERKRNAFEIFGRQRSMQLDDVE